MPELKMTSVHYYSPGDEDRFFEWLQSIPCVGEPYGIVRDLFVPIDGNVISDEDLQELIAIFTRYKTDARELRQFLNDENKAWFYDNKEAFWWNAVFGD